MASPGGGDAQQDPRRLFLGNLPKAKTEKEIHEELSHTTHGLVRVITYPNTGDPRLHRGFCFLDYESAEAAAAALQWLSSSTVFGCRTIVDWADPEPETDVEVMSRVRILYVRQYGGVLDEAVLAAVFGRYGTVERVKSLKSYAFVHFARRDDARAAMEALDCAVDADSGVRMEVSWAKPPADKVARERTLRDRERRMLQRCNSARSRSPPAVLCNVVGPPHTYTGINYDHYVYDFGRSTSGGCPGAHAADCARCGCSSGCPVAVAGVAPAVRTGRAPHDAAHHENGDSQLRDRGDRNVRADVEARVIGGDVNDRVIGGDVDDRVIGGDVDDRIRMFFFKLTAGNNVGKQ